MPLPEREPLLPNVTEESKDLSAHWFSPRFSTGVLLFIGALAGTSYYTSTQPQTSTLTEYTYKKPAGEVLLYKRTHPSRDAASDCEFLTKVVGMKCEYAGTTPKSDGSGEFCAHRAEGLAGPISFHNIKDQFEPKGMAEAWIETFNTHHEDSFEVNNMNSNWNQFMSLNTGMYTKSLGPHLIKWKEMEIKYKAHKYLNPTDNKQIYVLFTYNPSTGNVIEIHGSNAGEFIDEFTELPQDACLLAVAPGHSLSDLEESYQTSLDMYQETMASIEAHNTGQSEDDEAENGEDDSESDSESESESENDRRLDNTDDHDDENNEEDDEANESDSESESENDDEMEGIGSSASGGMFTGYDGYPYAMLIKVSHPANNVEKAQEWMSLNAQVALDIHQDTKSSTCKVAKTMLSKGFDIGKASLMFVEVDALKDTHAKEYIEYVENVHKERMGIQKGWDRFIDSHIGLFYRGTFLDDIAVTLKENDASFMAFKDVGDSDPYCQNAKHESSCGSIWSTGTNGLSIEMHSFFNEEDDRFFTGDFSPVYMNMCNEDTNLGSAEM